MSLYLVQHGKSLPKDVDPSQGLSEEGISETKRIAEVAASYEVNVSCINHSVKPRAQKTAEIFASALHPAGGILQVDGLKPLDDVAAYSGFIEPDENTMLVGHLPFMERMAAYLVVGSADKPIFRFQNSGIVCLKKNPDINSWIIAWTLMPNIG
jgi:phosphohistidine phosphatase